MARRRSRPSPTLTAKRRNRLPASSFAYPASRKYPIDTPGRARNALARAAASGNAGSYQHVAKAVRRKWGNTVATVGTKKGTVTGPGLRKGGKRPAYRKPSGKSPSGVRRGQTRRRRRR